MKTNVCSMEITSKWRVSQKSKKYDIIISIELITGIVSQCERERILLACLDHFLSRKKKSVKIKANGVGHWVDGNPSGIIFDIILEDFVPAKILKY